MRLPFSGLAIAAGLLGAGAVVACFGPTEVRVSVTTTVPCERGVETQIFSGAEAGNGAGAAPAAETRECTLAEPRIGTLVIVPSGGRDGRFDLEVIAGVGGVPIASCLARTFDVTSLTTGCISARRRVSFRPHKSLDLPVLLSDRCLNVPCGVDQTCDLGTCTPTADCTESGCPRERGDLPLDGGPGTDGGVVDATADAPILPARCGNTPEIVVDGQSIRGQLAADGADFVYLNASPVVSGASEIRRVSRAGGTPTTLVSGIGLSAVAARPQEIAWASDDNPAVGMTSITTKTAAASHAAGGFFDTAAIAFSGTTVVGFGSLTGGQPGTLAFGLTDPGMLFLADLGTSVPGSVPEVLVDDQGDFYGVAGGVDPGVLVHFQRGTTAPVLVGKAPPTFGAKSDLALIGQTLFVAAATPAPGLYRIDRASISPGFADAPWIPGVVADSMASFSTTLYYLAGNQISRVDMAGGASTPVPLQAVPPGSDRLFADDACVYWIEGKTRIMKRAR